MGGMNAVVGKSGVLQAATGTIDRKGLLAAVREFQSPAADAAHVQQARDMFGWWRDMALGTRDPNLPPVPAAFDGSINKPWVGHEEYLADVLTNPKERLYVGMFSSLQRGTDVADKDLNRLDGILLPVMEKESGLLGTAVYKAGEARPELGIAPEYVDVVVFKDEAAMKRFTTTPEHLKAMRDSVADTDGKGPDYRVISFVHGDAVNPTAMDKADLTVKHMDLTTPKERSNAGLGWETTNP